MTTGQVSSAYQLIEGMGRIKDDNDDDDDDDDDDAQRSFAEVNDSDSDSDTVSHPKKNIVSYIIKENKTRKEKVNDLDRYVYFH